MRRIVVLPLLALAVGPAVQADPLDTPFRDGPEFQVNTNTTGTQSAPGVAINDDGRFVVVWQGQGSNDTGLFMQRFDHNGMPQGGETRVNEDASGGPSGPDVAMNDSGFVVVWGGAYPPHDFEAVVARRFDAGGTPLGGDFQVNTYTTECQSESSVAMDDAGNFVIVWSSRSQDGSGRGVFGQRFGSTGAPVGSEFQVNTYTTARQVGPRLALAESGDFLVGWMGADPDGFDFAIFGQRYEDGEPVGGEFQTASSTISNQSRPAVAMDGAGNFVIVWSDSFLDGNSWGTVGRRFNSVGAPLGPEFVINTYTTGLQLTPSVAMDNAGNFVVVWETPQAGYDLDIAARSFDSTGAPLGEEFLVNTYRAGDQELSAIGMNQAGRLVVTWVSDGQDGSGSGIYAQRFRGPTCFAIPSLVNGLEVATAGGGADLLFTWTNTEDADDYVILEAALPDGLFDTVAGSAPSGDPGLVVAAPPGDRFFLVAGRDDTCGIGLQ